MSNQFYITLPSNSPAAFHQQNTISHYITQLPRTINLEGEWEVGLSEILYPHSWNNVRKGKNTFSYDVGDGQMIEETVEVGHYESLGELCKAIHDKVPQKVKENVSFNYRQMNHHVSIKVKNQVKLKLMGDIAVILGFENNTLFTDKDGNVEGPFTADVTGGMYSLFVYSDLVSSQIVGNVSVPLLRIVRTEGKDGDVVSKQYETPQYVSLERSYFSSIEIDIRDDTGGTVSFERGKVVVTLHFRRRRPQYL